MKKQPLIHIFGPQFEANGIAQAYSGYRFDPKTRTSRATSSTLPKAAPEDFEAALGQYRLAHQLGPDNASY